MASVEFEKSFKEHQIYEKIQNLFHDKLQDNEFEILEPVCGNLIKPRLAPGMTLNGSTLCTIFNQKPIYVRSCNTIKDEIMENARENDLDEENEDEGNCDSQLFHITESRSSSVEQINTTKCENSDSYDNEQFERDILEAVHNSLTENEDSQLSTGATSLSEELRKMQLMVNEENISRFNIYRPEIFECVIRTLRRKSFLPLNSINVTFTDIDSISEGSVDVGGPKREMFRLVMKNIKENLFEGPENCRNIKFSIIAFEKQYYLEAGKIIILSLIHGGPAPNFFCETLFSILMNGIENVQPDITDIYDMEFKNEIAAIDAATNLQELQDAIDKSTIMNIGGLHFVQNFDKKDDIVKSKLQLFDII